MNENENSKATNRKIRFSLHGEYYQICRNHVEEYEEICKEMERHRSSNDEQHIIDMNIASLSEKRERATLIAIVFAAMSLEAFVYDYGADRLSGTFMKNHIDKLELPSKFIVLSRITVGKVFPTDSQAYEGLRKLVKDRNRLVHYKSRAFAAQEPQKLYEYYEEMNIYLEDAMRNAYKTVENILREMDQIHDHQTRFLDDVLSIGTCHA